MQVKKVSYMLSLLGMVFSLYARGEGTILWWLVEPDDVVEDWYGSPSTIEAIGATDARLRVDDGNGNSTYLNFLVWDDDGDGHVERIEIGGADGTFIPVEAWADLSAYTDAAYSFAVELGNYDNGEWVKTLAASEPVSYDYLRTQGHVGSWSDIAADLTEVWHPSGYSVPEPSSGLLMLIGGAVLALRRRKGH